MKSKVIELYCFRISLNKLEYEKSVEKRRNTRSAQSVSEFRRKEKGLDLLKLIAAAGTDYQDIHVA